MEKAKQQVGASTTSSFTSDLFGPKDSSVSNSSPASAGFFGSLFGPSSTGLGKESPHCGMMGASRNQDYGSHYSNANHGNSGFMEHKSRGEKSRISNKETTSTYPNDRTEPCYFSSSIYYGGQQVYSPAAQTTPSHHMVRKDAEEDDPNGNNSSCASRGNWWQGSLYY